MMSNGVMDLLRAPSSPADARRAEAAPGGPGR